MFLYLIVRLFVDFNKDSKWLITISFLVVLTQLIISLLSMFAPGILPNQWIDPGGRNVGTLEAESVFSTTLIFFGTLLFYKGISKSKSYVKYLCLGVFLLAFFGAFLSFSRASWLGAIVVMLGLILLYPKRMIQMLLIVIPLVALFGVGLFSDQFRFANERLRSQDTALDRLPVYYAAVRMFESKPVTGWGYGNFDLFDRAFQGRVADIVNPDKDHASHNLYLTLLAEQGIIGATLYMAPVLLWLYHSVKVDHTRQNNPNKNRRLIYILWLSIFNHIVVNNFSNMRVPFGLGMWWITLGLIANLVSDSRTENLE
jgi:O-antigen ligase